MQMESTPLVYASHGGNTRLVEVLLAHGADINKVYHCNITGIQWNFTSQYFEHILEVLEIGVLFL